MLGGLGVSGLGFRALGFQGLCKLAGFTLSIRMPCVKS